MQGYIYFQYMKKNLQHLKIMWSDGLSNELCENNFYL